MKKFLFSAVALTVFSFSAMANNEVKEEKKTEIKETKVELESSTAVVGDKSDDCFDFANAVVDAIELLSGAIIEDCDEHQEAVNDFWNFCMQN